MTYAIWSKDEQATVTETLARAATLWPDRILLDFVGETYSYAEVDRRSTQLAHGLRDRGVAKGDRVGSLLDSNIDAVLLWLAVNKLGAVNVPVNTAYKGEFLRHQLAEAGCRVMVAEPDYALRIAAVAGGLPDGEMLLVRGDERIDGANLAVEPLAGAYSNDTSPLPDLNTPRDLCMLIFTGGTTGPSKGCMISHNYACNIARQILKRERRTEDTVNWTPLPLFHINATAGSILSCMMVGARVAIYPRFSVSNFWPDVERSKATVVNLLGAMIGFIATAPDSEASRRCHGQLKAVRGAPFTPELQRLWKERFGVTYAGSNTYGTTEAARVCTLPDGEVAPVGSSGRPNEDFDVRIVDDEDNEVGPGVTGEVVARPRHPGVMFDGYWKRPEETLQVMRNLWLHTGDLGKIDENGFFYFVDRKSDYLRRRGENISSFEMEQSLVSHPAVKEVAVHAVLAESEDEVKATVVRVDGAALTEEEFCRWCADRLPYFAVPRFIEFREDLPRNPVGRILKYQLRDEGCTEKTWDRDASGMELLRR